MAPVLVDVLLDTVERVLYNARNASCALLPHSAGVGLELSGQQLDEGRLAGAVNTNASDA